MKRVFLVAISMLVLIGLLVVPACGGGGNGNGDPVIPKIKIAIAGPTDYIQGEHMVYGAQMAAEEINALTNKVNVAGVPHEIELIIVDTDEIANPTEAGEKVEQAISVQGAQFVIGGFRTEAVWDMIEKAVENETIMFICGAATAALLAETVVDDYDTYKYIFRGTPINDVFLVNNSLLMASMVAYTAEQTLLSLNATVTQPRVAIFAESLTWADPIVAGLQALIPGLGYELTHTARVGDTADTLTVGGQLEIIEAAETHVIVTVMSGPVGLTYGAQTGVRETPAISVGINVEAQDPGYWTSTTGGGAYHITLGTYAPNIAQTTETQPFLDAFVDFTDGEFPVYTAASYDIVWGLKEAIEAVGVVAATDDIIEWFENPLNARVTATGTTGYYGEGLPSPFLRHDIIYGPDWVTGVGIQWIEGDIVGVWPKAEFGALANAVCLFKPNIDWSAFEHTGTEMFQIPPEMIGVWMTYTGD